MVLSYKNRIFLGALFAVALSWVRYVFVRVFFKGHAAPRPGDAFVSPVWFQRVVRECGFPDVVVKSVQIGGLSDNRGLAGQINRIEVTYAHDPKSLPQLPTKFILKTTNIGLAGRANCLSQVSWREAVFYNSGAYNKFDYSGTGKRYPLQHAVLEKGINVAEQYKEFMPRVWYAYGSSWTAEAVILQSDESIHNTSCPVNFVFGNQVWGVPKPVIPPRDIVSTLKTIFTTTATRHALHWNDEALLHQPWLKHANWFLGKDRARWEHSMASARVHWRSVLTKVAAPNSGLVFDDRIVSIMNKSLEESSWEAFQAHVKDRKQNPFTLTHGDFHASNMFLYRKEGSDVDYPLWFDWSEVGPWEPTTDLGQMLISDVPRAITNAHSKELIRAYYDALITAGVSDKDYTWQMCWNAFCRGSVERWLWLFCFLADFPLPANAIQYFHDQILNFLNQHCPNETHFKFKTLVSLL